MFARLFALLLALISCPAWAEEAPLRIGVLTDMSGDMAAATGVGSVQAAQMAVEDFLKQQPNSKKPQRQIIVMNADYKNRSDLAEHIAQDWIETQDVALIVDVPNPAIAARLAPLLEEKNKMLFTSSRGPATREWLCNAHKFSWMYDRPILTENLIRALLEEKKKRWFILGHDDMHSMAVLRHAKDVITKGGGSLVGEALFGKRLMGLPMALEQIKKESADIVFLAFDRPDITHLLRHWPKDTPADFPPLAFSPFYITDVHKLQEKTLPIFYTISPFYWAQSAASKIWAQDFAKRSRGTMPTELQASIYASVKHYLTAENKPAKEPAVIFAQFKAAPLEDTLFGESHMRKDGFVLHRLHLLQTLPKAEQKEPWDYFKVVRTVPVRALHLPKEANCTDKN